MNREGLSHSATYGAGTLQNFVNTCHAAVCTWGQPKLGLKWPLPACIPVWPDAGQAGTSVITSSWGSSGGLHVTGII